jgi:hypothetical protein
MTLEKKSGERNICQNKIFWMPFLLISLIVTKIDNKSFVAKELNK